MRRTLQALIVLGGTGVLVALPPEDYARAWQGAVHAGSRAYALVDKHIVTPVYEAAKGAAEGAGPVQTADATQRSGVDVDARPTPSPVAEIAPASGIGQAPPAAALTSMAPAEELRPASEIITAPAPRPALRPALVSDEARESLAGARVAMSEGASGAGSPVAETQADGLVPTRVAEAALRGAVSEPLPASSAPPASPTPPVPVAQPVAAGAVVAEAASDAPSSNAKADAAASPGPGMAASDASAKAAGDRADAAAQESGDSDAPPGMAGMSGESSEAAAVPPVPGQKPDVPDDKKPPVAAKLLFGAVKSSAPLAARAIGYYSRGCLSGAKALPVDGTAWQAMRLSRNRNWGHPKLVALIERFANEVQKEDGWPGLLVGDMSQPRGGPMLTGHSSHQIGLDADIWFTPMPGRRLSKREREDLSATSMLDGPLKVDPKAFTPTHVKVVKRAASYPEVERILVHPAIKKALCEAAGAERGWLGKVRPYFGHFYHFHVRISCPPGSSNCRSQRPPSGDDGCGKELDDWFARLTRPPRPKPPGYKPPPPKPPISLADLPLECKVVLGAGDSEVVKNEAELIKTSIERSKKIIDISGKPRAEALAEKRRQ